MMSIFYVIKGQNCKNCYFYDNYLCQRYPKSLLTDDDSWCGEWKKRKVMNDEKRK